MGCRGGVQALEQLGRLGKESVSLETTGLATQRLFFSWQYDGIKHVETVVSLSMLSDLGCAEWPGTRW